MDGGGLAHPLFHLLVGGGLVGGGMVGLGFVGGGLVGGDCVGASIIVLISKNVGPALTVY